MDKLDKAAGAELTHNYVSIAPNGDWTYDRNAMLNMFRKGAMWQSEQPIPEKVIDKELTEFFKSEEIDDVLRFASYTLICVSSMAINTNSGKTEISIEFTHKNGKIYKSKMLVTQQEISK